MATAPARGTGPMANGGTEPRRVSAPQQRTRGRTGDDQDAPRPFNLPEDCLSRHHGKEIGRTCGGQEPEAGPEDAAWGHRVLPGLRSFSRAYPGVPQAVRNARADVTCVLDGCPAADNVVLCLSEVASNAVLHSRSRVPGGHFGVHVDVREEQWVRVAVDDDGGSWDADHADHADRADGDIEHGHGLEIVCALTAEMGTVNNGDWRAVWFECSWRPREVATGAE